jgi:hypothetical protein
MAQFYQIEEARRIIADAGFIGRISMSGVGLIVYEGEEDRPGTWMEIARISIRHGTVDGGALHQFCLKD